MGFNEDIREYLTAFLHATTKAIVIAVLRTVQASGGTVLLVKPFDEKTGLMVVGIKQKGLLQAVSPSVRISIMQSTTEPGRVTIRTEIEQFKYVESTFHEEMLGRNAHRKFLTDLGVALRAIDPSCTVTIGTD